MIILGARPLFIGRICILARKTTKVKDNGQEFLTTLRELGKEKGIEGEVLFEAIEAALICA